MDFKALVTYHSVCLIVYHSYFGLFILQGILDDLCLLNIVLVCFRKV